MQQPLASGTGATARADRLAAAVSGDVTGVFAADVNTDAALMLIEEQWQQVMTGVCRRVTTTRCGGVVAR